MIEAASKLYPFLSSWAAQDLKRAIMEREVIQVMAGERSYIIEIFVLLRYISWFLGQHLIKDEF
jgi:hypothetical protein